MSKGSENPFELLLDQIREVVREEMSRLNADKVPSELLTPEELAGKLKLPVSWVYEQSRQRKIPTQRIGRYLRFDLAEVLESQKKNGQTP